MNIVVCVKQVIDPERISGFDWEANAVLAEEEGYITNLCDECAIEEAVRIKERFGSGQVILVSVGPPRVEAALHRGLARGADRMIRIWDDTLDGSDAYVTSRVLARAMGTLEYGLILCGERTLDQGSAQVGPSLAELLNLPHVSAITKLEVDPRERSAIVHRRAKGSIEVIRSSIPAVFSVNRMINEPRYVSFRRYQRASKERISEINPHSLVLEDLRDESPVAMVGLSPPSAMPQPIFTPDSSLPAAERIRLILSAGISDKGRAHFLEGSLEEVVSEALDFLVERGLV